MIDVDVVIVTRGEDRLLACLDSLAAGADGAVLSVTVVDSGTTDSTIEAVAARQDGTRIVVMGEDAGTATGANAGMARGTGRYILVLDPNTVVGPGSLRTLVEFADRHPSAGAVAPRLRTLDGRPHPSAEKGDRRGYEVSWVPGTAVLVPRVVHAATAGFDEDYFSLWADVDWCRRIRSAGYTVWCLPAATVLHDDRCVDDRAAELATARDYHDGAYRYWLKHDAPAVWHPSFWTKAATLRAQALSATLRSRFAPRSDAIEQSRLYQPRRAQPQL